MTVFEARDAGAEFVDSPSHITNSRTNEHLMDIMDGLFLAREVNTVVAAVRKAVQDYMGADSATFNLCERKVITPMWRGREFPVDSYLTALVMITRQPAIIEDIRTDDRIPGDVRRPSFVKSLIMLPIRPCSPIGVIGAYWSVKYSSPSESVKILKSLGDIASFAIRNIQIYRAREPAGGFFRRSGEMITRDNIDRTSGQFRQSPGLSFNYGAGCCLPSAA